ncbi:hypothetical protein ACVSNS_01220 [Pseudomonas aeruginosa]
MTATEPMVNNEDTGDSINLILAEALQKIDKDLSLRPTVAELARQAKIHRNTIYLRNWPLEKLTAIRERRIQNKSEEAFQAATQLSPDEALRQSRLEIIYWFTMLQDARASNESLTSELRITASSRDIYIKLATERLEVINSRNLEITKLRDALTLLEEELSRLKS